MKLGWLFFSSNPVQFFWMTWKDIYKWIVIYRKQLLTILSETNNYSRLWTEIRKLSGRRPLFVLEVDPAITLSPYPEPIQLQNRTLNYVQVETCKLLLYNSFCSGFSSPSISRSSAHDITVHKIQPLFVPTLPFVRKGNILAV